MVETAAHLVDHVFPRLPVRRPLSIESLNNALEKYAGTLIFVSHDREFVSSLATRIIEIRTNGTITDYRGNHEEYLASQGVD